MTKRKDLPLEEKLKIPVLKLPFSKTVKNELYYKGVHTLSQLVNKYHRNPGMVLLPGFKDRVFAEAGYLLVAMGLDYGKDPKEDYTILGSVGSKLNLYLNKKDKEKIDSYASKEI